MTKIIKSRNIPHMDLLWGQLLFLLTRKHIHSAKKKIKMTISKIK